MMTTIPPTSEIPDSSGHDLDYRFGGIRRLYGQAAYDRFQNAHVCIVGIGGVGSWAAEALARSAIGHLTLIDLDDICVSNINRQIHALDGHIGQLKVEAMAERIRRINPHCQVNARVSFLTEKNLAELINDEFDYVLDAIDSVKMKTRLIAHCKRQKIPIVCAGGAGGQTDPTQIQMADLGRTYQDPLLAKVRSQLRKNYGFSSNPKRKLGIDCVFSTEQLTYPKADGEVCQQKPENNGPVRLDCASGFGAVTHITATFGFFAVSRVLQKIAARGVKTT
ncbi:ATP-dependent tRNA threonylcarbamoyladenosine dehydratase/tRNA(ANN) ct(6)A37 cyclic threonylcarbamoyladenosine biosynthesis enzyme [Oleiphilus messinensis]|uniref:tRNA threonylcarbamoyladenosine dehydratase n=2 Tax=Oleiphilus messinensis TaxID=141451 RepID=A0A1Y0I3D7_9GAMM|nr:ATP-dependent tRNA threonylcarbamoyladenosine dehydratase/tRNA(ANN) ct(6)A37 cyclic threonylcarbamoyladenosine biosynthesis enzyme [Oleiphilus messinensis]